MTKKLRFPGFSSLTRRLMYNVQPASNTFGETELEVLCSGGSAYGVSLRFEGTH